MEYDSWLNVRLMNCKIFIFTSSLSFGPFFVLSYGGGGVGAWVEEWIKPSLLDCLRLLPRIKGQLFKRSLNRTYVSYSKLQRRVICEPYFVSCVTIFIFLHRNKSLPLIKVRVFQHSNINIF